MSKNNITIHAIISGKVQGVFYRKQTQTMAHKLKLNGWIKNLPNGNVELKASGHRDHIMEFTDWLWQGPEDAEVINVHWEIIDTEKFDEFVVEK